MAKKKATKTAQTPKRKSSGNRSGGGMMSFLKGVALNTAGLAAGRLVKNTLATQFQTLSPMAQDAAVIGLGMVAGVMVKNPLVSSLASGVATYGVYGVVRGKVFKETAAVYGLPEVINPIMDIPANIEGPLTPVEPYENTLSN